MYLTPWGHHATHNETAVAPNEEQTNLCSICVKQVSLIFALCNLRILEFFTIC